MRELPDELKAFVATRYRLCRGPADRERLLAEVNDALAAHDLEPLRPLRMINRPNRLRREQAQLRRSSSGPTITASAGTVIVRVVE